MFRQVFRNTWGCEHLHLPNFQVCAPPLAQSPLVDSPASLDFDLKVDASPGARFATAPPPASGARHLGLCAAKGTSY